MSLQARSGAHLVVVNEAGRRAVVAGDLGRVRELGEDVLREDLAELDSHLVCGG